MWVVQVFKPDSADIERVCGGPDSSGFCRTAAPGDPVGCAGRAIYASEYRARLHPQAEIPSVRLDVPSAEDRSGLQWKLGVRLVVSASADECPLSVMGWS
jgi:hypothetical protein